MQFIKEIICSLHFTMPECSRPTAKLQGSVERRRQQLPHAEVGRGSTIDLIPDRTRSYPAPHYCAGSSALNPVLSPRWCRRNPQHRHLSAAHQAWHLYEMPEDMAGVSLEARLFPMTAIAVRWPVVLQTSCGKTAAIPELMRKHAEMFHTEKPKCRDLC